MVQTLCALMLLSIAVLQGFACLEASQNRLLNNTQHWHASLQAARACMLANRGIPAAAWQARWKRDNRALLPNSQSQASPQSVRIQWRNADGTTETHVMHCTQPTAWINTVM